jgi:WD40 repeat protein
MGCSNERTIEKQQEKNKGYPVCRFTVPITREICSMIAINPKTLILGGKNELLSFDFDTKEITVISSEIKGRINCLLKTPEGNIMSGGQDTTIKIWDIANKKLLSTLEGHTSIIWELQYLDKDRIISACDDNSSRIWNLNDKSSVVLYQAKKNISSIAVIDSKKVLLASGKNVLLFDVDTKEQLNVLDISSWALLKLKNGDIAAGLGNGLLYLLKVTDEVLVKLEFPRGHKKTINTIIQLENNKLVTSSDENELIMWDCNEPESIYMIKGHEKIVTAMCLIEGNKFASVAKDNSLKIWE